MQNTEETLESFAEEVRKTLGKALADLGLGSRDRAINALGKLLDQAESIVHRKAMEKEKADPDRFALAALRVDLQSAAPEIED